jgi:hypothetical protein
MTSKYDPEHEPEKYWAISWLCEACFAEGDNAEWQLAEGKCPKCGSEKVGRTASVLRHVQTGEIIWGGDYWCDCCADSLLPGVLFPWDEDVGHAGVEKCDTCQIYQYDDDAAAALAKLLGPEYEVHSYQVFEDPNAAGAFRFAVFPAGPGKAPLTFDEGRALWYRVAESRIKPKPTLPVRRLPELKARTKE